MSAQIRAGTFRLLHGRLKPHILTLSLSVSVMILTSCSALSGGAPTAAALLPTRTLAPIRTVAAATPEPTQTPFPTQVVATIGPVLPVETPLPTRVSSMTSCASVKLDATTTANAIPAASEASRIVYVNGDGNIRLTDGAGKINILRYWVSLTSTRAR